MKAEFTFTNGSYFYSLLSMITGKLGTKGDEAGREISKLFLDEVHQRLYPGHGYRTGRLYNSYYSSHARSGFDITIGGGTSLEYAPYVEYRWGGKVSHFRPAVEAVKQNGPEIIKKHFNKIF